MKKILILLIAFLGLSLPACSLNQAQTNENLAEIAKTEIRLTNNHKAYRDHILPNDKDLIDLYDKMDENQQMYYVEVSVLSKEEDSDKSLDFALTDADKSEHKPDYFTMVVGKPSICKLYFILEKDLEIEGLTTYIEKDGELFSHTFPLTFKTEE